MNQDELTNAAIASAAKGQAFAAAPPPWGSLPVEQYLLVSAAFLYLSSPALYSH